MAELDALQWSLIANAALAALLVATVVAAKRKIIREKLASFSTGIAAITAGLAQTDKTRECDMIARSLCGSMRPDQAETVGMYLYRAAVIQTHRAASAADMFGEIFRYEAIRLNKRHKPKPELMDLILSWEKGQAHLRDTHGDVELAGLQLWHERQIIESYQAKIVPYATRLLPFG